MVGKKSSLEIIQKMLIDGGVERRNITTTAFKQGRTHRWAVAWTFLKNESDVSRANNKSFIITTAGQSIDEYGTILQLRLTAKEVLTTSLFSEIKEAEEYHISVNNNSDDSVLAAENNPLKFRLLHSNQHSISEAKIVLALILLRVTSFFADCQETYFPDKLSNLIINTNPSEHKTTIAFDVDTTVHDLQAHMNSDGNTFMIIEIILDLSPTDSQTNSNIAIDNESIAITISLKLDTRVKVTSEINKLADLLKNDCLRNNRR